MERYELVEGKSSKFWEVTVEGPTLTVHYGRIGTNGQTNEKDFADEAAALKEKAKLIKEKTGKGYVLTGSAVSASTAAKPTSVPVTVKKAKAESEKPAKIEAAAEPRETIAPAPAAMPALVNGTAELEAILAFALPTRTRPGTPLDGDAAWKSFCDILQPILEKTAAKERKATRNLSDFIRENGKQCVANAEGIAARVGEIDGAAAALRTPQEWRRGPSHQAGLDATVALIHWAVARKGAVFALEVAHKVHAAAEGRDNYRSSSWSSPVDVAARRAVVKAPKADYQAAVAWALEHCEGRKEWTHWTQMAFILADDRPEPHDLQPLLVLQAAENAGEKVGSTQCMIPLIVDAQPSWVAQWRLKQSYFLYMVYCEISMKEAAATAVAVARHHGEPAQPTLDWLFSFANEEERTDMAELILTVDEEGALALLMPFLHEKWIRAALDRTMEKNPALSFRQYLSAMAAGRVEPAIRSRIMGFVNCCPHDSLRQWAATDPRAESYLEKLLDVEVLPVATGDRVPQILRDPPWRKKAKKTEDIVLVIQAKTSPFANNGEAAGEVDHWRSRHATVIASRAELLRFIQQKQEPPKTRAWYDVPTQLALPGPNDSEEQLIDWTIKRIKEICKDSHWKLNQLGWQELINAIDRQPEDLALALWEQPLAILSNYCWRDIFRQMLRKYGERAVPGMIRQLEADPIRLLEAVADIDEGGIAPGAARALLKLKTARPLAVIWLRRHRKTAITRLIPDAVGKPGPARDAAEYALRWFVNDREDGLVEIEAAIAVYAEEEPEIAKAMAQVINRDPFGRFPAKIAALPSWYNPSIFTQPVLKDGSGILADDAINAIGEMLSFSTPDAVYAGVTLLKELCTPDSLGRFSWDVFSAWLTTGAPSKEGWAMRAVGWLGDDECVRQLTRLIRKWPGEAAHARAVTGLDVLIDIGSDVALMNLNSIAEKLKFKGLQEKAREKIAALAEARGLTSEELSDRLAPDLDLDERGGLDLDFGERKFRAGFDEFLKPWVKDETGKRLKDLPKPNKSDDAELSSAAVKRWGALKKDARAAASLQIARLENMLSTSRRVQSEVFWLFFASHPLIRHLAQRLVWGLYGNDDPGTAPKQIFRVADDLSVTDASDDMLELDFSADAEGKIGLVHPLHLPAGGLDAWGALFGDYEISQPFPQLGRETWALEEKEKSLAELDRFAGLKIESARMRGMASRGWTLGAPQDGGGIWWLERNITFPDGKAGMAHLTFANGLIAGGIEYEDKHQTLEKLSLRGPYHQPSPKDRTFGELDPVSASELLRGLCLLAETAVP